MADLPTPKERFEVNETETVQIRRIKASIREKQIRIRRTEADIDELLHVRIVGLETTILMVKEEIAQLEKQLTELTKEA